LATKHLKVKLFLILLLFLSTKCYQQERKPDSQAVQGNTDSEELMSLLPQQKNDDSLIVHNYFIVSYSRALKNPEWTIYKLKKDNILSTNSFRRRNFTADPKLNNYTANSWDFSGSGYERGHMVPAEDMDFAEKAMEETFFMTNVAPQLPQFNRGIWKKMENVVRKNALLKSEITVITGSFFPEDSLTKIENGIAIPQKFYKVLFHRDSSNISAIAFVLPHEQSSGKISDYAMSVAEAEQKLNIIFFYKLAETIEFKAIFKPEDWILD
jgi:endonuclease G, mitochondrial